MLRSTAPQTRRRAGASVLDGADRHPHNTGPRRACHPHLCLWTGTLTTPDPRRPKARLSSTPPPATAAVRSGPSHARAPAPTERNWPHQSVPYSRPVSPNTSVLSRGRQIRRSYVQTAGCPSGNVLTIYRVQCPVTEQARTGRTLASGEEHSGVHPSEK